MKNKTRGMYLELPAQAKLEAHDVVVPGAVGQGSAVAGIELAVLAESDPHAELAVDESERPTGRNTGAGGANP